MKKKKKALKNVDIGEVQELAMAQQKRDNRHIKKGKNQRRRNERLTFKSIGNERYKINLQGLSNQTGAPDKGERQILLRDPETPVKPEEIEL